MENIKKNLENIPDHIVMLFVVALFIIDFLPHSEAIDIIYPQFFYLAVLNCVIAFYISLKVRSINSDVISSMKKSYVFWVFFTFIIICGLSFITANNKTLVLEKFIELLIALCILVNFTILLKNRLHLIPKIVLTICIVAFFQSCVELYYLKQNADKASVLTGLHYLAQRTGNINVLAASLTIKLPFLLIGFTHYLQKRKVFLFIALILVTMTIFLTAARTALISTALIYIVFIIYNFRVNSFSKSSMLKMVTLVIPVVLSILITNIIFKKTKDTTRYSTLTDRVEQINTEDESANLRLLYWKNTFDLAKTKPFIGIGLGNYKIESIPYEKTISNDSNISLHSHNDFLEITAETGFINGLLYLSLFVFIVFVNIRRILKSDQVDIQSLSVLTLMITIVYGMDALLNFPMFRPTMLIFLCLIMVFTLINTPKSNLIAAYPIKNNLYWFVFLISTITVYFAFLGYKASNLEYLIQKDNSNSFENRILTGDELLEKLPKYKNTLSTAESFYEYAAIYYIHENKFDKALKYLGKADKINPNFGRIFFYKMNISNAKGNIDSAYVYSKKAFYLRPRNLNFFKMSTQFARAKKDTIEILKEHKTFIEYRNIPEAWKIAVEELEKANYNNKNLIGFVNKGTQVFPSDSTLLKKKKEIQALDYIEKGRAFLNKNNSTALEFFKKALNADPTNADTMQNIAYFYFNAQNYKEALNYFLKALELRQFNSGRTEFFIGNCYLKLNDKANACKYFEISNSKKFPEANSLTIQNCK